MNLSQKCQYALRAALELAMRYGEGPVKIARIAKTQMIPMRFLQNILRELNQADLVASTRGKLGGYYLAQKPSELSMGDVIRTMEGRIFPVSCEKKNSTNTCELHNTCVLLDVFAGAHHAMMDVYDIATFDYLAQKQNDKIKQTVINFSI